MVLNWLLLIVVISVLIYGKNYGCRQAVQLLVSGQLMGVILAIFLFYEVGLSGYSIINKLTLWFNFGGLEVTFGILYDSFTVVLVFIVMLISLMVHIYSISYMSGDIGLVRFISFLSLFSLLMLILVTANNYMQMFLGWEGVGVVSYLLINFWYRRLRANLAALKAMIVNRISDFGFLLGIIILCIEYGTSDYSLIFLVLDFIFERKLVLFGQIYELIQVLCFCLFIGVMGKSAQIGFHIWLPDAMEGPTPVSALIHAATMVTAGVYLLLRSSHIFVLSLDFIYIILLVGGVTALWGSLVAVTVYDLKKVIAYSTCSQLGYMVFGCGLSLYILGVTHLLYHAVFKALLFLTAGLTIHMLGGVQDMRNFAGNYMLYNFIYIFMLIGFLALMGFPFISGYYSKDIILSMASLIFYGYGNWVFLILVVSSLFTGLYSFRLMYSVYWSVSKGNKKKLFLYHLNDPVIYIVLLILGFMSIWYGFLGCDIFLGIGCIFFKNALAINMEGGFNSLIFSELVNLWVFLLPFFGYINSSMNIVKLNQKILYKYVYNILLITDFKIFFITSNKKKVNNSNNKEKEIEKELEKNVEKEIEKELENNVEKEIEKELENNVEKEIEKELENIIKNCCSNNDDDGDVEKKKKKREKNNIIYILYCFFQDVILAIYIFEIKLPLLILYICFKKIMKNFVLNVFLLFDLLYCFFRDVILAIYIFEIKLPLLILYVYFIKIMKKFVLNVLLLFDLLPFLNIVLYLMRRYFAMNIFFFWIRKRRFDLIFDYITKKGDSIDVLMQIDFLYYLDKVRGEDKELITKLNLDRLGISEDKKMLKFLVNYNDLAAFYGKLFTYYFFVDSMAFTFESYVEEMHEKERKKAWRLRRLKKEGEIIYIVNVSGRIEKEILTMMKKKECIDKFAEKVGEVEDDFYKNYGFMSSKLLNLWAIEKITRSSLVTEFSIKLLLDDFFNFFKRNSLVFKERIKKEISFFIRSLGWLWDFMNLVNLKELVIKMLLKFIFYLLERGFFEYLGEKSVRLFSSFVDSNFKRFMNNNGVIKWSILAFFIGVMLFLIFLFFFF